MLVISDTSVISNLAIIGQLQALRLQHSAVLLPEEVMRELRDLPDTAALGLIQDALHTGWLLVTPPTPEEIAFAQTLPLDPGESEAIAIAKLRGADRLCIDEADGRAVATRLGIQMIGVLGILLAEKRSGRLDDLSGCLARLEREAGFFMSKPLVQRLLQDAGEA